jgi:DNA topoisomerase-1
MSKNLVIVESPAKAKTIGKFLGKDFVVKSSFGHIRDLPKKGMSVDIANNFTPVYEVSSDKKKVVSELKKAAKEADTVWLASDEDREGEAIAWHLAEVLKLDPKETKRIVFHEITEPAIKAAIQKPRTIDIALVDAQQARRILDRIVGYELSPVLWKKVRTGLSAGRVQSVAVRLIVEREREIEEFQTTATFKVTAQFTLEDGTELKAECPTKFETEEAATKLLEALRDETATITDVKKTPGTRSPGAPFTTSTLQQEASRRLGYSPKQTMMLAQRLYENGHITYMRTDSVNLSKLAIGTMGEYIKTTYGTEYHQVRTFTTKSAGAQEAHEAIRPTHVERRDAGDDAQQKKLYDLIWKRSVSSQMAQAKVEKTTITIGLEKNAEVLEAKGEIVTFAGFLKVWAENKTGEEGLLPEVSKGDILNLISALAEQTFSRPPARYTEATLVRQLEEMGIGRPSTYAPTISTIQDRGYVEKTEVEGKERDVIRVSLEANQINREQKTEMTAPDRNKLIPTSTGKVVTDFLAKNFSDIVSYDFTKGVEEEFDDVADGKVTWQKMLAKFYGPFHTTVEKSADVSRAEAAQARLLGNDPKSGKPVSARFGRFGPMVQIGNVEDEEKPKFAGITNGKTVDNITLEEALKLFSLPRNLGKDEKGNEILANIGRFGPYVKIGSSYVSIKGHDPYSIELDTALELIKEDATKKAARNIKEFEGTDIKVLNGRYGPYITDGTKNAKIPKDTEPADVTLEQAKELLEKAPTATRGGRRRTTKKK